MLNKLKIEPTNMCTCGTDRLKNVFQYTRRQIRPKSTWVQEKLYGDLHQLQLTTGYCSIQVDIWEWSKETAKHLIFFFHLWNLKINKKYWRKRHLKNLTYTIINELLIFRILGVFLKFLCSVDQELCVIYTKLHG